MAQTRASTNILRLVGEAAVGFQEAVEAFLADCRSRNLSPNTVQLNGFALRRLSEYLATDGLADVTPGDLRRFFADVASSASAATAARYYTCIRSFFKFTAREGFRDDNPALALKKPKAAEPLIEPLTEAEVEAMVNTCKNTFTDVRDRFVLLALLDSGLRASELAALTVSDVNWETQTFVVRHGKGDKARAVPFGNTVAASLRQYLARRGRLETAALVVNTYGEPTDRYRVRQIVVGRAKRAGIERRVTTHLLRHTCAVGFLRAGGDCFHLQQLLGHSSLQMSRRYCELADSDLVERHRLCSPADRLRLQTKGSRRRLK